MEHSQRDRTEGSRPTPFSAQVLDDLDLNRVVSFDWTSTLCWKLVYPLTEDVSPFLALALLDPGNTKSHTGRVHNHQSTAFL